MITAHESLANAMRHGAGLYGDTALAHNSAPVVRKVRRARATRAAVGTVAGVGIVGALAAGGTYAARYWSDAANPAATPTVPSPSASPSVSPPASPEATVEMVVATGPRIDRVAESLAELYGVEFDDALAAIVAALPPEAGDNPEGWVMAGAYDLPVTSLDDAAAALVSTQVGWLESAGVPRDEWHRAVVIASIVEQETPDPADMARTARVILNREAAGMMLNLETPLLYVARADEQLVGDDGFAIDSPYNTFMYEGLPPGAIGAPSPGAMVAATTPAEGDWLYFLKSDDGGPTQYFVTFEEYAAAVDEQNPDVGASG